MPVILCGIDRSAEAANAAKVASDLAVQLEVPLLLLHVAPTPWVSERPAADYLERLEEKTAFDRAGLVATLLHPIEVNPEAIVEHVVEFGEPTDAIRTVAEQAQATHIVVGSRGEGAIEAALMPSTVGGLLQDAPAPVIVVPPAARWTGGSSEPVIVCGSDGSEGSRAAVRAAGELSRRLGARLLVATVAETTSDDAGAATLEETPQGLRVDVERLRGEPAEELTQLADRMGAALVAVGSRGRGVLQAAVLGSVSRGVIQKADRPVMVVSRAATAT